MFISLEKFLKEIITLLIGREDQFKPDHRFLNFVAIYTFLVTLSSFTFLIIIEMKGQIHMNLTLFFIFLTLYYFSRIRHCFRYLPELFFITTFLFIAFAWFVSEGINGMAPYYSYSLIVIIMFLVEKGSTRYLLIALTFTETLALTIIEYLHPDSVTYCSSRLEKCLDLFISIFTASIYVIAATYFSKHLYIREKESAIELLKNYRKNSLYLKEQLNEKIKVLSIRERDVFKLIIEGKSNKEISNELNISLGTTKVHINNIYKKLNVKKRTELINKNLD